MNMKNTSRSLTEWALASPLFPNHMSFIVGPRQVGKTTLAKQWIRDQGFDQKHYLNFDQLTTRRSFTSENIIFDQLKMDHIARTNQKKKSVLVLDEIHKMRNWKRSLKGVYDVFRDDFFFIVTGSGRLDAFQRGGDSLAGRFDANIISTTPSTCRSENLRPPISIPRRRAREDRTCSRSNRSPSISLDFSTS